MQYDLVTQLREMVARSLALAVRAHEQGHNNLSRKLIARAIQCAGRASALEAMQAKPREE